MSDEVDFASFVEQNVNAPPPEAPAEAPAPTEKPSETPVTQDMSAKDDQKPQEGSVKADQAQTEEQKPTASDRVAKFRQAQQQERDRLEQRNQKTEVKRLQEELTKLRAREEKLKNAPLETLENDFGVPYTKVTDEHIKRLEKDPRDPILTSVDKQIADLKSEITSLRSNISQRDEQATLREFESNIREQVSKDESLTYLPEYGDEGVEQVRAVIQRHFWETSVKDQAGQIVEPGEVMTTDEAVKLVEDFYAAKKEAAKAKKQPKASQPKAATEETKPKQVTLTADMNSSAQQQPKTPRDEIAEQIEWLKSQGLNA